MITVSQIREHLIRLLDAKSVEALDEFDQWFAGASWNMHQDSDLPARAFASAIELRLAEYDSARLGEEALFKELSQLLREHSIQFSLQPVAVVFGSSSSFSCPQWTVSVSGNLPVKAYE